MQDADGQDVAPQAGLHVAAKLPEPAVQANILAGSTFTSEINLARCFALNKAGTYTVTLTVATPNGQEALANLTLTREAFQTVRAETILPGGARYGSGNPAWAGMNLSAMLMDAQGLILPYAAQFDEQTQTVQALVPDGTYSLLVTVTTSRSTAGAGGNAGGGGGGSGGLIIADTLSAWTAGTTVVTGGTGGALSGSGAAGATGGSGNVLIVVLTA